MLTLESFSHVQLCNLLWFPSSLRHRVQKAAESEVGYVSPERWRRFSQPGQ